MGAAGTPASAMRTAGTSGRRWGDLHGRQRGEPPAAYRETPRGGRCSAPPECLLAPRHRHLTVDGQRRVRPALVNMPGDMGRVRRGGHPSPGGARRAALEDGVVPCAALERCGAPQLDEPRAAMTGSRGFWRWFALHALLYMVILAVDLALWTVADVPSGEKVMSWIISMIYALIVVLTPTVLITAVIWTLQGLPRWAFRMSAVLLCSLPLCLTPESHQLAVIVPVQVLYGLLIVRPRTPLLDGWWDEPQD